VGVQQPIDQVDRFGEAAAQIAHPLVGSAEPLPDLFGRSPSVGEFKNAFDLFVQHKIGGVE
jgi:hypothetical protein